MINLLFLAANPKDLDTLHIFKEITEINQAIQEGAYSDQFKVNPKTEVKYEDLLKLLEDEKPDVVHFSCHSSSIEPEIYWF